MSKRDEYLAKAMGICWHEPMTIVIEDQMFYICKHCGMMPMLRPDKFIKPSFSEWIWFEFLLQWTKKNPYFMEMFMSEYNPWQQPVTPDLYADMVYAFLQQKEMEEKENFFERIRMPNEKN
ncbi:MAG TPA: hypothetical protein P5293_05870 [Bacteroidales bacterium]|nr:hypothetical protein [Bacteroidales bacterium]